MAVGGQPHNLQIVHQSFVAGQTFPDRSQFNIINGYSQIIGHQQLSWVLGPWNMFKATSGITSARRWDDLLPASFFSSVLLFAVPLDPGLLASSVCTAWVIIEEEILVRGTLQCSIRQEERVHQTACPSYNGECASLFWCCHNHHHCDNILSNRFIRKRKMLNFRSLKITRVHTCAFGRAEN